MTAEERARKLREIRADVQAGAGAAFAEVPAEFGAEPHEAGHGAPLRYFVPRDAVHGFCDWLIRQGATSVTVQELDFVYTASNALWDRLKARLDE